jgi:hypothetical protein
MRNIFLTTFVAASLASTVADAQRVCVLPSELSGPVIQSPDQELSGIGSQPPSDAISMQQVCLFSPPGKTIGKFFCGAVTEGGTRLDYCPESTSQDHQPQCVIGWMYVDHPKVMDNQICVTFHNTSKSLVRHIGLIAEVR